MFPTVEQSVPAHLISQAPEHVAVPVCLTYRVDDPLAVRMTFPASACLSGASVTWTFARVLLDRGLRAPAGMGDVRVRPSEDGRTLVELRSPEGVALLRFTTARLRHFLLHSYATVPAELEERAVDVDRALAELLGQTRG
ncbi:SsgA family sporulation/cell division regulator [Streptomyces sp. NPDC048057]|uniref:SsgA family sporulation/cell division regulator n=1 Tax=Streptomyces sp. NPDC048057 TaxID=3155628 RepID=UPI0033FE69CD